MRHADLVRLARILGMLGSDHAGERASAALAAHRLLKASGRSWWDLLGRAPPPRWQRKTGPARSYEVFHDAVAAAEARMRQLRGENQALSDEVKRLRRLLDARTAARHSAGLRRQGRPR